MDETNPSRLRRGRRAAGNWKAFYQKRIEAGLTQARVGAILGVDGSTVGEWELLKFAPQRRLWRPISMFLGITLAELAQEIAVHFPMPAELADASEQHADLSIKSLK